MADGKSKGGTEIMNGRGETKTETTYGNLGRRTVLDRLESAKVPIVGNDIVVLFRTGCKAMDAIRHTPCLSTNYD